MLLEASIFIICGAYDVDRAYHACGMDRLYAAHIVVSAQPPAALRARVLGDIQSAHEVNIQLFMNVPCMNIYADSITRFRDQVK